MTKKRTLSIFFLLVVAIFSIFAFTACGKGTTYKLYSYKYSGTTYSIGDTFYGIEIKEDLVSLSLNDGNLELKISRAFLEGNPTLKNEYETFTGSYTETDSTIIALIPDYSSEEILVNKVGNSFSLKLSSTETIILKK